MAYMGMGKKKENRNEALQIVVPRHGETVCSLFFSQTLASYPAKTLLLAYFLLQQPREVAVGHFCRTVPLNRCV